MLSFGADSATAGILTAGAVPVGTGAALLGGAVSVGVARGGGEAGPHPGLIQEGLTADRDFVLADLNTTVVVLRPPSAVQGKVPALADQGRAGVVLRRQLSAVPGPGQVGQGRARALDSAEAGDPEVLADPGVAAAAPEGVAAEGPDPEAVDPAAREAAAGTPVIGNHVG